MQEAPPLDRESEADRPTLPQLLGQLASDTSAFAQAELDYLRAQAGERASYALPGLAMIGVAVALGFGAIVALLIGLVWLIGAKLGTGLAVVIVVGGASLATGLLINFGARRLRDALKPRSER
jgi:Putative Actinobacterial Holin-X, holin superfamily III